MSNARIDRIQSNRGTFTDEQLNFDEEIYMVRIDHIGIASARRVKNSNGVMWHRGLYEYPDGTKYWTFVPGQNLTKALHTGIEHLRDWHMWRNENVVVITDPDQAERERRSRRKQEHERRKRRREAA
jgi:hypothetical protein